MLNAQFARSSSALARSFYGFGRRFSGCVRALSVSISASVLANTEERLVRDGRFLCIRRCSSFGKTDASDLAACERSASPASREISGSRGEPGRLSSSGTGRPHYDATD